MSNVYNISLQETGEGLRAARLAEEAGCEHLGMSLYELAPGNEMVFHYHVQREEILLVLGGDLSLRTATGWEQLPEGEVVAFPRAERGAHGHRNNSDERVRVLRLGLLALIERAIAAISERLALLALGASGAGASRVRSRHGPSSRARRPLPQR